MSLPNGILATLSKRDITGYQVATELADSMRDLGKSYYQQVYRELKSLADENLLSYRFEPRQGKPDQKIYSITDLGRQSLTEHS